MYIEQSQLREQDEKKNGSDCFEPRSTWWEFRMLTTTLVMLCQVPSIRMKHYGVPAFLDFRFNVVYNSILFSSPLVLLCNLDFYAVFSFRGFFMCPHINIVNRAIFKLQYSNFSGYSRQEILVRTKELMAAYPEKMDVSNWSCLYTMDNYIALNLIFGTLFQNYVVWHQRHNRSERLHLL